MPALVPESSDEVIVCAWCECEIPDGSGIDFEPEDESGGMAGTFCGIECWLAAA